MRILLQLRELTQAAQQLQLVSTRLTLLHIVSAADLVPSLLTRCRYRVLIQHTCTIEPLAARYCCSYLRLRCSL